MGMSPAPRSLFGGAADVVLSGGASGLQKLAEEKESMVAQQASENQKKRRLCRAHAPHDSVEGAAGGTDVSTAQIRGLASTLLATESGDDNDTMTGRGRSGGSE